MGTDRYEVSLWSDILVPESNGVPAHFEEKKLCIIGSDSMRAACRVIEPKLVENVNGTNTFSFKMFYKCIDTSIEEELTYLIDSQGLYLTDVNNLYLVLSELKSGQEYTNPFLTLLTNERKVKVLWKNKWYDLIIKNCQEDSGGKSITYTCSDAYINELSKNGFSIVFDTELENNQGTALELGARTVDQTDWKVIDNSGYTLAVNSSGEVVRETQLSSDYPWSDIIRQEKEDAVYKGSLTSDLECTKDVTGTSVTIPGGSTILIFYQQIAELIGDGTTAKSGSGQRFQFLYAEEYVRAPGTQLVENGDCYSIISDWNYTLDYNGNFTIIGANISFKIGEVSSQYRAKQLIYSQKSIADSVTGKYCSVYRYTEPGSSLNGHTVYHYIDTKTETATAVVNVLAGSSNFTSTTGWVLQNPTFTLYPTITNNTDLLTYNGKTYLRMSTGEYSNTNFNSGLTSCGSYLPKGLQSGSQYVFRYKAKSGSAGAPDGNEYTNTLTARICNYETDSQGINIPITDGAIDFLNDVSVVADEDGWYYCVYSVMRSITRQELANGYNGEKVGFFVVDGRNSGYSWIEEVQFFPYVSDGHGGFIRPGELDKLSLANLQYNYYDHTVYGLGTDPEDIRYLHQGPEDWQDAPLTPIYNEDFVKISSVSAKQSNRFNIIQSIAESFNCWARFYIPHNENGSLLYNSDGTAQKFVYFKEKIGEETGIGFVYGIDLKTIQRTLQSDNIVTKTIVSPNTNDFALNGSCNIARANVNYSKSNSILNFDYYVSQGMINNDMLVNDLYSSDPDHLGYYRQLNRKYTVYDNLAELVGHLETEQVKLQGYYELYLAGEKSATEQITSYRSQINLIAGQHAAGDINYARTYLVDNQDADKVRELVMAWRAAEAQLANYTSLVEKTQLGLNSIASTLDTYHTQLNTLLNEIRAIELAFYKKYARFIQEGSWQDDSYMDDNLYYIDGVALAQRSAKPQVSYNISVLRLSSLEEYKSKVFNLGDIAYIQDTDFFGYTDIEGIKTPYKEKVIISEITSNFDEPDKDAFKVQNYKSAFDDLFQRVTAATQSLQYSEGEYRRAASVVTGDGAISAGSLQAAFDTNKELALSSTNNLVYQDQTGITISSVDDASHKVKINSNGIFISTDGGATWKNAIRSGGVATEALTAGNINTEEIILGQENTPTFRWDFRGINAYAYSAVGASNIVDTNTYVRFDQYGVYGMAGASPSWSPTDESSIWNNKAARFGVTWNGFFLKNIYDYTTSTQSDPYTKIEISSENDFQITTYSSGEDIVGVERIKIGNLAASASDPSYYGIRIRDKDGNVVLSEGEDGHLWLKDALYVGDSIQNAVRIGYFADTSTSATDAPHQVINCNNNFIVDEKGNVRLLGGITWGDNGPDNSVDAITEINRYYLLSSDSTGVTRSDSGWSTIPPTVTSASPFLWIYEEERHAVSPTKYSNPYIGGLYESSGVFPSGYSGAIRLYTRKASATPPAAPQWDPTGGTNPPTGWSTKPISSGYMYQFVSTHLDGAAWSTPIIYSQTRNGKDDADISQVQTFNELTNDGILYGCFGDDNGELFINAYYIKTGALVVGNALKEILYADVSSDHIMLGGFGVWDGHISNSLDSANMSSIDDMSHDNSFYLGPDGIGFQGTAGIPADHQHLNSSGYQLRQGTIFSTEIGAGSYMSTASNAYFSINLDSMGHVTDAEWNSSTNWLKSLGSISLEKHNSSGPTPDVNITFSVSRWYDSAPVAWFTRYYGNLNGHWIADDLDTSSDRRLKNTIISLLPSYTNFFDHLRPVSFFMNKEENNPRTHIGFIAQEVRDALKLSGLGTQFAIYDGPDDDDENSPTSYLKYNEFIALNTWQIQLLKSRVSELEERISKLELLLEKEEK